MQKLLYISNGVQLEIDRVIVVPLEILNRHCSTFLKCPYGKELDFMRIDCVIVVLKRNSLHEF
ncbi:hypothetical protein Avbf_13725 [Armadillidium vulgare]|nr:hypothetical protein Avbf_13725 [Armadillidium vulgare]